MFEYSAEVSRGDPKATAEYNFSNIAAISPGAAEPEEAIDVVSSRFPGPVRRCVDRETA
jgi:hypothetical protein